MRSLKKGSLSAVTQVKVSSPVIIHDAPGQGFHFLETNTGSYDIGECESGVPGSKSTAGKRTVYTGTWENRNVPTEAFKRAEKAMRKYVIPVVGLTHSRGVNSVTAVESVKTTLEGVSSSMQGERICYAIH